jgi:hypothetical protein
MYGLPIGVPMRNTKHIVPGSIKFIHIRENKTLDCIVQRQGGSMGECQVKGSKFDKAVVPITGTRNMKMPNLKLKQIKLCGSPQKAAFSPDISSFWKTCVQKRPAPVPQWMG